MAIHSPDMKLTCCWGRGFLFRCSLGRDGLTLLWQWPADRPLPEHSQGRAVVSGVVTTMLRTHMRHLHANAFAIPHMGNRCLPENPCQPDTFPTRLDQQGHMAASRAGRASLKCWDLQANRLMCMQVAADASCCPEPAASSWLSAAPQLQELACLPGFLLPGSMLLLCTRAGSCLACRHMHPRLLTSYASPHEQSNLAQDQDHPLIGSQQIGPSCSL